MHPISSESLNRKIATLKIKFDSYGRLILPTEMHKVKVSESIFDEAALWCQRKCRHTWIWSCPFQSNTADIYFKYEEDAVAFKLKYETISET